MAGALREQPKGQDPPRKRGAGANAVVRHRLFGAIPLHYGSVTVRYRPITAYYALLRHCYGSVPTPTKIRLISVTMPRSPHTGGRVPHGGRDATATRRQTRLRERGLAGDGGGGDGGPSPWETLPPRPLAVLAARKPTPPPSVPAPVLSGRLGSASAPVPQAACRGLRPRRGYSVSPVPINVGGWAGGTTAQAKPDPPLKEGARQDKSIRPRRRAGPGVRGLRHTPLAKYEQVCYSIPMKSATGPLLFLGACRIH